LPDYTLLVFVLPLWENEESIFLNTRNSSENYFIFKIKNSKLNAISGYVNIYSHAGGRDFSDITSPPITRFQASL
jgi:hypothetical protein